MIRPLLFSVALVGLTGCSLNNVSDYKKTCFELAVKVKIVLKQPYIAWGLEQEFSSLGSGLYVCVVQNPDNNIVLAVYSQKDMDRYIDAQGQ